MERLLCRTIALFAVVSFTYGCAQAPGTITKANTSSLSDWPTPTISTEPAPQAPEPTLVPQAAIPDQTRTDGSRASTSRSTTTRTMLAKSAAAEAPRDVWQRIRGGFQMTPMDSALISDWESYYASRPEYFARMIDNSRYFLYHVVTEVERRGMPLEIALLPMIESAYNPVAHSSANASGIWQFIPSTGKNYGLRQNWWYDGRRDVIAATNAALDYLQNLYVMFNDWELALAAYNWGEGAVQRAVERNQAKGLPINYQSLTNMPAETRNYLPKLMAVKNIIADPARFGLALMNVPNEPYLEIITVKRHIDVTLAAKFADLSLEEFKFLNPAHNKPVINADSAETIALPKHKVAIFQFNLEKHEGQPLVSWKTHTVKPGERIEKIAQQYSISVAELNAVNNISARRRISTGQTLLVPTGGTVEPILPDLPAPVAMSTAIRTVARRSGSQPQRYAAVRPAPGKRVYVAPAGKRVTSTVAAKSGSKTAARKVAYTQNTRR